MVFKCVKYRLVSAEQNCSWEVFWILSPSAADILIINSPVNKQFCASVGQKEGRADLKPGETGFPEPSNERVILQICFVLSRKEILIFLFSFSFLFFFLPCSKDLFPLHYQRYEIERMGSSIVLQ